MRAVTGRGVAVLAGALLALGAGSAIAGPVKTLCAETPEPARWTDAGTPDVGRERAILAVHRGAAELAPENTIWAYRYATAYDVEMIEIDVQQTVDHKFVSFHDLDVAAKTDGTGLINTMTYDQVRRLNAADNPKWKGSVYDPAQIPSLDEVLALARDLDVGIMFDLKESVTDAAKVANKAARYGLLDRSVFIPYVPVRAEMIKAAQPTARMILSNQGWEELPDGAPRGTFFALARAEYWAFGSSLPGFDKERIAEIHDGCGVVIPNVYQGDVTGTEFGDLLHARSLGADGAQVNNPDVAVDALDRPVPTVLEVAGGRACLLDGLRRQGLPKKRLDLPGGGSVTTALGGCAPLPAGSAGEVRFSGDGSALPAGALVPAAG